MPEFIVGEDGLMTERAVCDLATWYNEHCPKTDRLSFEVHLMLIRTYGAMTAGSQFEARGGLSRARYNVLRVLHQAEDKRLLMSEIVDLMNVSPTNITKLVDGLVGDGLVRRVSHAEDKRKTWAELTEEGLQVVEMAMPGVATHTHRLWSAFSDEEKRLLIHLLAKFRLHAAIGMAEGRVLEGLRSASQPAQALKVAPG
jgi:DNA-binding MarR family transcriptional regulator